MIRQKVTITNPTGLHLRPAGMFCNIASRYKCKVEFMYNDDTAANAKSVLSVLGACVKSGDEIELICDGEDEEEAMKAMMDAVESGLGSALILEFLLYYMTKPEYQIHVREHIYLDNMLDLF